MFVLCFQEQINSVFIVLFGLLVARKVFLNLLAVFHAHLGLILASRHSPGIAQPSRDSIDGNMDPALHPLVSLTCPVAAYQFNLQVVQGVDVGEAVTDRAL